jgi:hypothetical protein
MEIIVRKIGEAADLVLCSSDLYIDEYIYNPTKDYNYEASPPERHFGYASTGAHWLKDGDKLTIEDIERGGGYILWYDGLLHHWSKQYDAIFRYAKIKCRCCNNFV